MQVFKHKKWKISKYKRIIHLDTYIYQSHVLVDSQTDQVGSNSNLVYI